MGKVVIRPDSGDPVEMVILLNYLIHKTFSKDKPIDNYVINEQKNIVFPSHIGLLQGDGIDFNNTAKILSEMLKRNMSPSNVIFGSGGGLLQKWNRDTLNFAIKATKAVRYVNNVEIPIAKEPITAPGKASKVYDEMMNAFKKACGANEESDNVVYEWKKNSNKSLLKEWKKNSNKSLLKEWNFDEIRTKLDENIKNIFNLEKSGYLINHINEEFKKNDKNLDGRIQFLWDNMPLFANDTEYTTLEKKLKEKLKEKLSENNNLQIEVDKYFKENKGKIGLNIAYENIVTKKNVNVNENDINWLDYAIDISLASMANTMKTDKNDKKVICQIINVIKEKDSIKKKTEKFQEMNKC
jgi:hypothetical protein